MRDLTKSKQTNKQAKTLAYDQNMPIVQLIIDNSVAFDGGVDGAVLIDYYTWPFPLCKLTGKFMLHTHTLSAPIIVNCLMNVIIMC